MTVKERAQRIINFINPVDPLPLLDGEFYWDLTYNRWKTEGLDVPYKDIRSYFGTENSDGVLLWSISEAAFSKKQPGYYGMPIIKNEADYDSLLPDLYKDELVSQMLENMKSYKDSYDRGDNVVSIVFHGFFWHSRDLFGIEPQFYAFYDYPELIRRMNRNLCDFVKRALVQAFELMVPFNVIISEDMSYKTGPMLSKAMFDDFIKPYYLELAEITRQAGTKLIVDSDGNVHEMIPWMIESGVDGMAPFERNAGNDICKIREQYPDFIMGGGYDKLVMNKGEAAIRAEFERILPVMRSGGYFPGVDHQTPPSVSFSDYKLWISVFREYAARAVKEWNRP